MAVVSANAVEFAGAEKVTKFFLKLLLVDLWIWKPTSLAGLPIEEAAGVLSVQVRLTGDPALWLAVKLGAAGSWLGTLNAIGLIMSFSS